jgi:glycosyltransferase involved in cell wall biosynthesis
MKLLFVHDHIYKVTSDLNVYSYNFSYEILNRYRAVFSEITVLARCERVKQVADDIPISSGDGVEFLFLDSISNIESYFKKRAIYKRYIKELLLNFDAIIVRVPSEFGIVVAKVAIELDKIYLVEVVGCGWDSMISYGGVVSKIYAPILYLKMRFIVSKATHIIYVSDSFLQSRYPPDDRAKVASISNVDLEDVDISILRYRHSKIKKKESILKIGTVARLDMRYKGVDIALKALSCYDIGEFEYHILGLGERDYIDSLIVKYDLKGRVYIDSFCSDKDSLNRWIDEIDIYIQPSRAEGLSRALIEVMSRGVPSIGSNVGAMGELLDTNVLFDVKESGELIAILKRLSFSKTFMLRESKRNFYLAKRYNRDVLNQKRESFLESFKRDIFLSKAMDG